MEGSGGNPGVGAEPAEPPLQQPQQQQQEQHQAARAAAAGAVDEEGPLIPERLRVEDEDAWFRRHGLREPLQPQPDEEPTLDQQEAVERWNQMNEYQTTVFQSMFAHEQAKEQEEQRSKAQQLQAWNNDQLVWILNKPPQDDRHSNMADSCSPCSMPPLPLTPFAQFCDVIFALARTPPTATLHSTNTSRTPSPSFRPDGPRVLECPLLDSYTTGDIQVFVRLVLRQYEKYQQATKAGTTNTDKDGTRNDTTNTTHLLDVDEVWHMLEEDLEQDQMKDTDDSEKMDDEPAPEMAHRVVQVCCMADYLQNIELRDVLERILQQSIDTSNCLSLCQLADQLGMPTLFELALQHMMETLEGSRNGSLLEDVDSHAAGESTTLSSSSSMAVLTPELRERIALIQTAIQSSVHDTQRSKLYFHSVKEYIALFAERVQYFQERLAQAKEDQLHRWEQMQQEQEQQHSHRDASSNRSHWWNLRASSNRSNNNNNNDSDHNQNTGDALWNDTQAKIDKQEQRVQTLKAVLAEQKKLFAQHDQQQQQQQRLFASRGPNATRHE